MKSIALFGLGLLIGGVGAVVVDFVLFLLEEEDPTNLARTVDAVYG
jgi:hypothetical protein